MALQAVLKRRGRRIESFNGDDHCGWLSKDMVELADQIRRAIADERIPLSAQCNGFGIGSVLNVAHAKQPLLS